MQLSFKSISLFVQIALYCNFVLTLKHHLVLTNDRRSQVSVSSFGYNLGGRLEVIVQNLTLSPDPSEEEEQPQYGFVLVKSDQARNPYAARPSQQSHPPTCLLNDPRNQFKFDLMTLSLLPNKKKVLIRCVGGKNAFPVLTSLGWYNHRVKSESVSLVHPVGKRAASEMPGTSTDSRFNPCSASQNDLPLEIEIDDFGKKSYSFNFTFLIGQDHEEATYYVSFHNCKGFRVPGIQIEQDTFTHTKFNLSMLIYETNYPDNYLSAGAMPLPQMYFILSVMFFLSGCVWFNFIKRQKENSLKLHTLMTVLVSAKACSLLFHGINYHYIAIDGQPVVTWAYLYYATRTVKGALFFITLALIGSGWTFIKHILSMKDKKIILVIVALQVIAHIAEIVLDESTEGEASIEFWAQLCALVDLFSCIAILIPITWSVRHLEEASRTDGKAAMNLKKMELFKSFYIVSTIYIYVTRIMTFVFLSMLAYKYSWLAELFFEMATLIYYVVTGYYFQPMPTNPYLLLSADNDLEEDILFSVNSHEMSVDDSDNANLLGSDTTRNRVTDQPKVTRRVVEDLV